MANWKFVDDNIEKNLVPSSSAPPRTSFFNPKKISNIKRDIRDYSRLGSRVAEQVVGLPGNLASLGLGAANYLSGGKVPTYESIQSNLPISLPTSSQTRESISKLTGGYTEPETEGEKFWDDVVSDTTALLIPIPGVGKLKSALRVGRIVGAGAQALAGNLAGKLAKNLGLGEGAQTAANLGTTFLTGMIGTRSGLNKRMTDAFKREKELVKGKFAPIKDLRQKMRSVVNEIEKRDFSGKELIEQRIKGINKWLGFDRELPSEVPLDNVVGAIQDLNSFYDEAQSKKVGKHLRSITQPIREFLDDYAKSPLAPKEFAKNYYEARDLWKGSNNSSKIGDFLSKKVSLNTLKNPVSKLIILGSPWFHKTPHVLGGIGAAIGVREAVKFADLIANSSVAAQAFKEIGIGALNQSAARVNKGLKKFDKAVSDYGYLPPGANWVD